MRTGFPCNESRFFPVGIDLQGKAVSCTGFGFTVRFTFDCLIQSNVEVRVLGAAIKVNHTVRLQWKLGHI